MNYAIKQYEIVKEDGVEVNGLLTLEVTYSDGSTTEHNKVIPLDSDVKEEAVTFAAELEKILVEPKEVTTEAVEVEDPEIKKSEVEARVAEMEPLTDN